MGIQDNKISCPINPVDNRLELKSSSSYTNTNVLQDPWINNDIYLKDGRDGNVGGYDFTPVNGQHFTISVNLRRENFVGNNNIKDNTSVLAITLPWTLTSNSSTTSATFGLIAFDGMPDTTQLIHYTPTYINNLNPVTDDRGYGYGQQDAGGSTTFFITRNMLPNSFNASNASNSYTNITLSANFTCNKTGYNPKFKYTTTETDRIDSLNMNVYYYGNTDILLNWIRISDLEGDSLMKGVYDSQLHDHLNTALNTIRAKGYNVFRIYGIDEPAAQYNLWNGLRYYNRICGGMYTTEGGGTNPRYTYHIGTQELWTGGGAEEPAYYGAPFYSSSNTITPGYYRMGFYNGFNFHNPQTNPDTLNGGYETMCINGLPYTNNMSEWQYIRATPINKIVSWDPKRSSGVPGYLDRLGCYNTIQSGI